jgi:cobalt-zinc-cadmium efflux system protein
MWRKCDLHLWELAPGAPILTAHVLVAADSDCHAIRRSLEQMLRQRFQITHHTAGRPRATNGYRLLVARMYAVSGFSRTGRNTF